MSDQRFAAYRRLSAVWSALNAELCEASYFWPEERKDYYRRLMRLVITQMREAWAAAMSPGEEG